MRGEYREITEYDLDELRDEEASLEQTWHANSDVNERINEIENDVNEIIETLEDDDLAGAKKLLKELSEKLY